MPSVGRASFCARDDQPRQSGHGSARGFQKPESTMRIMTVYAYLTSYSLTLRGAEITIDNDVSWVRMDRNDQLYFEKSTV